MNFHFSARRLLTSDISSAADFYGEFGKDYSFASPPQLSCILKNGELWGCFNGGTLAAVCGFLPLNSPCAVCRSASDTRLLRKDTVLLLPPCSVADFMGLEYFYRWCAARAEKPQIPLCALLPVKSGYSHLPMMFRSQLQLVAIRPLFELRPYYIFLEKNMKLSNNNSIMVPVSDTFKVSQMLETGFFSANIFDDNSQMLFCLEPTQ
ncbi:MAG: hypothetical protein RSF00_01350 [Oscillospiraceae bacterium]